MYNKKNKIYFYPFQQRDFLKATVCFDEED